MADFKNKEEYEKWKAQRLKEAQEKITEKKREPTPPQTATDARPTAKAEQVSVAAPANTASTTKKCKHCAMVIPSAASVCPYCRKKQSSSILGILGVVLLLLIIIPLCTGLLNKNHRTSSSSPSDFDAYFMSQTFIKKVLKAPATAEFASFSESSVGHLGTNKYRVTSYVDAQNSFGAKLRNHYTCDLQYSGNDMWNLISYQFLNQ